MPSLSALYSPDKRKENDYLDKSNKRNGHAKLKPITKSPRTINQTVWNPNNSQDEKVVINARNPMPSKQAVSAEKTQFGKENLHQ